MEAEACISVQTQPHTHTNSGTSWAVVQYVWWLLTRLLEGHCWCQQPGTESRAPGQSERVLGRPWAERPSPTFIVESSRGHLSQTAHIRSMFACSLETWESILWCNVLFNVYVLYCRDLTRTHVVSWTTRWEHKSIFNSWMIKQLRGTFSVSHQQTTELLPDSLESVGMFCIIINYFCSPLYLEMWGVYRSRF